MSPMGGIVADSDGAPVGAADGAADSVARAARSAAADGAADSGDGAERRCGRRRRARDAWRGRARGAAPPMATQSPPIRCMRRPRSPALPPARTIFGQPWRRLPAPGPVGGIVDPGRAAVNGADDAGRRLRFVHQVQRPQAAVRDVGHEVRRRVDVGVEAEVRAAAERASRRRSAPAAAPAARRCRSAAQGRTRGAASAAAPPRTGPDPRTAPGRDWRTRAPGGRGRPRAA